MGASRDTPSEGWQLSKGDLPVASIVTGVSQALLMRNGGPCSELLVAGIFKSLQWLSLMQDYPLLVDGEESVHAYPIREA